MGEFFGIKKITLLDFELAGYGFLNYEFAVLKWDLIQNSHKKNFINKVMDEFLNAYITQNIVDIDYNLINFSFAIYKSNINNINLIYFDRIYLIIKKVHQIFK